MTATIVEREIIIIQGDTGDDGTGFTWITLTQLEYDALPIEEQQDPSIIYNIDFL